MDTNVLNKEGFERLIKLDHVIYLFVYEDSVKLSMLIKRFDLAICIEFFNFKV